MVAGRERQWDVTINGTPFRAVPNSYTEDPIPALATQAVQIAEEPREYRSWHHGFGWSQMLIPNTTHYCDGLDTRFPRQIIMGPLVNSVTVSGSTNVSGFFEQSSNFYVLAGRYCKQLSSHVAQTPDDGVAGKDFGANTVATVAFNFDGNTYVYFSSSTYIWQFNGSAAGWSQSSDTYGTFGGKFYVNDVTTTGLAGTYTNSAAPSTRWVGTNSSPLTASNYGSSYRIGDTSSAITGAATWDRLLFISKRDGLYAVQGNGLAPRILEYPSVNANNGKNMWADGAGYIWIPTVVGYIRYNPRSGDAEDASPGRGMPNASPIYGRVTAACEHKGWHYAFVYNGTDSYLMAGRIREEGEPGIGPMIWHGALAKVSSASVDAAYVLTTASPPELWFGAGTDARYFLLPANGDNPLLDSNYAYAASGTAYFPADDWNAPGTRFAFMGLECENEGFSSSTYADALLQLDDGSWQTLDRIQDHAFASIPVPTGGDWRFAKAALRLDITNGASTSTPKIRSLVPRAARRIKTRGLVSLTVYCADDVASKMGIGHRLTGADQLDALKDLGELGPVIFEDYYTGSLRQRYVLVQPVRSKIVAQAGNEPARLAAEVTMNVLTELPTPAYYGTAVYGIDRWS